MFAGIDPQLGTLLNEARAFTGKTLAESTKATYRSQLRTYLRFCIRFRLCPLPANQSTLIAYVAFLARTLKTSSIGNYLNIIRLLHLDSGLANPIENNFALHNLRRGIARAIGAPPNQKLPITIDILYSIKRCLCMFVASDISIWAACVIAFYGFLRKSRL